jgi:hypothetical protein
MEGQRGRSSRSLLSDTGECAEVTCEILISLFGEAKKGIAVLCSDASEIKSLRRV